ncbi:MAG: hypothetical protein AB2693_33865, partial [Candidatus Thiodiazotropha sp.]
KSTTYLQAAPSMQQVGMKAVGTDESTVAEGATGTGTRGDGHRNSSVQYQQYTDGQAVGYSRKESRRKTRIQDQQSFLGKAKPHRGRI